MKRRILRLPQVMDTTGLPRSTIYGLIKDGSFPKPIPLAQRSKGWLESDVQAWIEGRIQAIEII